MVSPPNHNFVNYDFRLRRPRLEDNLSLFLALKRRRRSRSRSRSRRRRRRRRKRSSSRKAAEAKQEERKHTPVGIAFREHADCFGSHSTAERCVRNRQHPFLKSCRFAL